jgi:hypothetical protein
MGLLDLMLPFKKHSSATSDSESSVLSSEDEVDKECEEKDGEVVQLPLTLPDANKFKFLHSKVLSNPSECYLVDRLLNEIIRSNKGCEINYKHGNKTLMIL